MMTNVKPEDLNYHRYSSTVYDRDIRAVIPGHKELHRKIQMLLKPYSKKHPDILELGIGTGLTAASVLKSVPEANYTGIDFSRTMLNGAKRRLSKKYRIKFILGDYSFMKFPKSDIIISVIGIHHQTNQSKRAIFRKIFKALRPGGVFIFSDLVTYRERKKAAINDARHYAHMVRNSSSQKSLEEWSYHHKFQNILAPLEDQLEWLKSSGFSEVKVVYNHMNTALIIAKKC